jgi:hypothetical protein
MKNVKDIFLDNKIPNLEDSGYFFLNLFSNMSKDMSRFGAVYANKQFESPTSSFLYIVENFPEKKLQNLNDKEFFYNHIPDFTYAKQFMKEGKNISWTDENKIHTIVAIPSLENVELESYAKVILDSKETVSDSMLSKLINFLPDSIKDWNLVSIFAWFDLVREEGIVHLVRHLHGNYEKDGKYINVELAFGCSSSIPEIVDKLSPPENFVTKKSTIKLGNKDVVLQTIKDFKGETEVDCLAFLNKEEKFSILVHNNKTTKDFKSYEGIMKDFMLEMMDMLSSYSLNLVNLTSFTTT